MKTTTTTTTEPLWLRRLLTGVALAFIGVALVVPLAAVFLFAFGSGIGPWLHALTRPDTLHAIQLTLVVVVVVMPVNVVFGVAAAWLLARFRFAGKGLLLTVVDLPFSVSPVVAGLLFVLLFGRSGLFGPALAHADVQVIFAVPGIVLTTLFVTLPFVARELLPVMTAQGFAEEEAAYTLGAGPWRTFFFVTLPKVRWALLYGVVLANARALGEFGAVSVVSGHIRGVTSTMPLQAEILYNEYDFVGCWAVASLLALFALITLVIKQTIEHLTEKSRTA
ncbi:MAG: sulfate ABC transporter permease subunit CysW [Deltaproteobacteria bacterium]|nr:sulfate ABC transporter permease subunit CysW [Deltaproteobacteria bacterium]